MLLPSPVNQALERLRSYGFESYVVGGCVRDMLMDKKPHDYDIATNALPKESNKIFGDFKTIPTGLRYGTITVIIEGWPLEITTYRIDGEYTDNRRPDYVNYSRSLAEDLARRDFTINAMAYHPDEGLIDVFGGRNDLKNKIIRCVGDPMQRFYEDALRILRGIRFCSELGFYMEPATKQALRQNLDLLENISAERIQQELNRILCGQNTSEILDEYFDVIKAIIPELSNYKTPDWESIKSRLKDTPRKIELRMAVLLSRQNDQNALQILKRLRYSRIFTTKVHTLLTNREAKIEPNEIAVKKCLCNFGREDLLNLLEFKKALGEKDIQVIEEIIEKIINSGECWNINQLAVNGKDLLDIGIPEGKLIGRVLHYLLQAVVSGKVPNNHKELLQLARNFSNKNFRGG